MTYDQNVLREFTVGLCSVQHRPPTSAKEKVTCHVFFHAHQNKVPVSKVCHQFLERSYSFGWIKAKSTSTHLDGKKKERDEK